MGLAAWVSPEWVVGEYGNAGQQTHSHGQTHEEDENAGEDENTKTHKDLAS
jgi:hypothetical protein